MNVAGRAAEGHAGDVNPTEVWRVLAQDTGAQLVDVRSAAEWTFVGVPDLSTLGKSVHLVEWQRFPGMELVADFADQLKIKLDGVEAEPDTLVFFLCRSGVRSASAARVFTSLGYSAAYNIAGGFEGDLDRGKHRGQECGWKQEGLPWHQS